MMEYEWNQLISRFTLRTDCICALIHFRASLLLDLARLCSEYNLPDLLARTLDAMKNFPLKVSTRNQLNWIELNWFIVHKNGNSLFTGMGVLLTMYTIIQIIKHNNNITSMALHPTIRTTSHIQAPHNSNVNREHGNRLYQISMSLFYEIHDAYYWMNLWKEHGIWKRMA